MRRKHPLQSQETCLETHSESAALPRENGSLVRLVLKSSGWRSEEQPKST